MQSRIASRVDSMPNAVAKRFGCHMGLKAHRAGTKDGRDRERKKGNAETFFAGPLPMLVLKGWFPLPLVLAVIVSALGVCVGRLSCPNEGMCLPFSP